MLAPGKYDGAAEMLLRELKAKGIVLLVIEGKAGHGMSVKADPLTLAQLPNLLIMTANQITKAVQDDLEVIAQKFSAEARVDTAIAIGQRQAADFHEANARLSPVQRPDDPT